MNSRELSEKLDELATKLDKAGDVGYRKIMNEVAEELRKLSNEKYAPGNSLSWSDVRPKSVNNTFTDTKTGKKLPF